MKSLSADILERIMTAAQEGVYCLYTGAWLREQTGAEIYPACYLLSLVPRAEGEVLGMWTP